MGRRVFRLVLEQDRQALAAKVRWPYACRHERRLVVVQRALPRRAAAVASGTRVVASYGDLAASAARLAGALRDRFKLSPGDRVAIAAKNSTDTLALMYGVWHAGLAAVPANAKLHGAELGYILEHSGARICFASAGIDGEIAPHAPKTLERLITIGSAEYQALFTADPIDVVPRAPDDLAWLFYASGTTGRPKGAMLTHHNLAAASDAYAPKSMPFRRVTPFCMPLR